ncbi:hypothetical protein HZH68_002021 [Vespula germanica]|uniref:Uncharacterized protein n=1 Tax=Vespula germanica TaxID=30212 RepID=A0A834KX58_VESGE|nr:hypothetical protein HZH68_002021 [Vespula germanica]
MKKVGTGSLGHPLLKVSSKPLSSTLRATAELAILFKPVDNGSTEQISWDLNRRNNRREQGQRCWVGEK